METTIKYRHNDVIARTIYWYYLEKNKEYRKVCNDYNNCTDMNTRRLLRKKKQSLLSILSKDNITVKISLSSTLNVKYKSISPAMVDIKKKINTIKRELLWQKKTTTLSK